MTTTVQIAITGNKKVNVKILRQDGTVNVEGDILPGQHKSFLLHSEMTISATEVGDFIGNCPEPEAMIGNGKGPGG